MCGLFCQKEQLQLFVHLIPDIRGIFLLIQSTVHLALHREKCPVLLLYHNCVHIRQRCASFELKDF